MTWTRRDQERGLDASGTGWDSEMVEYPWVFEQNGLEYMLFNGDDYGRTGIGLAVRKPRCLDRGGQVADVRDRPPAHCRGIPAARGRRRTCRW